MPEKKQPGFLEAMAQDFLIGGVSASIAKTCTAPIERVKLVIQTQDANPDIISGKVPRYNGIAECFTRISAEQGVAAFWRGNFTNILRYFPTQAFNFAFKDALKKAFPKKDPKKEFWAFFAVNMVSGGVAGAGSLSIVYPLDYARTRLASDVGGKERVFKGLGDCIMKTAKGPGGVMSLYNGFGVSVVGIIPYRGVYFGMFDTLKESNPYQKENSARGFASKFAVAQITAITAGFISYPFDTVRRRLQMQSEKPVAEWKYKGSIDCCKVILQEEGMNGLFKGVSANVLRTVGAALVLVMYDSVKTALGTDK
jgi:solute carrier family 25 (adenine nucleotide translocator) protein 4/5/6/31